MTQHSSCRLTWYKFAARSRPYWTWKDYVEIVVKNVHRWTRFGKIILLWQKGAKFFCFKWFCSITQVSNKFFINIVEPFTVVDWKLLSLSTIRVQILQTLKLFFNFVPRYEKKPWVVHSNRLKDCTFLKFLKSTLPVFGSQIGTRGPSPKPKVFRSPSFSHLTITGKVKP